MSTKKRLNKKHYVVAFIVAEILIGSFLAVVSFLFFLTLASQINSGVYKLDESVMKFVYSLRSAELTPFMFLVSLFGGTSLVVFSCVIFLFLVLKLHRHEAVLFLTAFLTGFLVNIGLKEYIARNRPEISPLYQEYLFSFPSGHAMNSLVFYFLLVFLIYRFTKNKLLTTLAFSCALILIALIGFSRVYLGVHFPSDVLGGFVAGFWWILTVLVVEKTLVYFRLTRRHFTE